MAIKIKDFANIQTGVYAKPMILGDIIYLQAKHFNEFGEFDSTVKPEIAFDKRFEKHLLKNKDILFIAKGSKNIAVICSSDYGKAVASSSFFVIRIKDEFINSILPEYLLWCLNHPENQRILKSRAKGSSLPSISIEDLGDLEIEIPDLLTQELIIKINNLSIKEKHITLELIKTREKYIQYKLARVIENRNK